ncbi:MAG: hypothetical protein AAF903_12115 [Pseudomonadota bacterium]
MEQISDAQLIDALERALDTNGVDVLCERGLKYFWYTHHSNWKGAQEKVELQTLVDDLRRFV